MSAQGVPVGRVGVLHGSSTRTRGAKPGRQARAEREARGLRVDQNPRKQGCHNDISRKPQESNESETCQNDTPTRVNPASEDSRPVIGDRSEVSPVTGLYKTQINKQIPFSPYGAFPPESSAMTNTPSADGGPISEPCEETGKPVNHAEDSADDALDALADARTGLGLEAPRPRRRTAKPWRICSTAWPPTAANPRWPSCWRRSPTCLSVISGCVRSWPAGIWPNVSTGSATTCSSTRHAPHADE